jgi:phosphoribosyl 1,2-cyclic phosphodiesterase
MGATKHYKEEEVFFSESHWDHGADANFFQTSAI